MADITEVKKILPHKTIRLPRLAINLIVLSGAELLSKVLAAIAFAYLARVLGPQGYGNLEFALAIIFFLTLFVDSGLSPYSAREIAKNIGAVNRLTAHIIFIRYLLVLVALSILVLVTLLIDKPWPVKQLMLVYSLTLLAWPGLLQGIFQGRDMMAYVAIASIIRWSLFAAGVFLFVHGGTRLWLVALIEGASIGCMAVYYFCSFGYHFGVPWQRLDFSYALSIFRQALPIGASEIVWAVKVYSVTVVLGLVITGPEVGWFGAAHRFVIALHTFVWLYFFNLLPSISRCTQGTIEDLHRLIGTSIRVTAWLAVFFGIVSTIFAEPIITLLYGSQYHETVGVFQVLIWLVPLALMSGHYRYTLIGYNQQRLEFTTAAIGAGFNILLNLFLIPAYGLPGAAWAMVLSEVLIWIMAYYFVRRRVGHIATLPHLYRPLAGGAILVVVLYLFLPANIWLDGLVAIIVYGLALSILHPELISDIRVTVFPGP